MSIAEILPVIRGLSTQDQLDLAFLICDGISDLSSVPELTDEDKQLLDERIILFESGNETTRPIENVLRELRKGGPTQG